MASVHRFTEVKAEVDSCLDRLRECLDGLTEGSLDESTQTDAQLQAVWRSYFSLKDKQTGNLQVAVLALAKSGKSTLLNALIGSTLLPSTNVPETARICQIQHSPDLSSADSTLTYQANGQTLTVQSAAGIHKALKSLSSEMRGSSYRPSKADEQPLVLRTNIAAIGSLQSQSESIPLELLDTPGPNEAGEEHLRFKIERLLDSVDAVVYLLDYTKLKTQEEQELLVKLRSLNPRLFGRLSSRLFFCVNKVDQMGDKDLSEEDTKRYVADLLNSQLAHPSFQLTPDQVLLVSAKDGLQARLQLRGQATAKETEEFKTMAFGRVSKGKKSQAEVLAAAEEVLEASGLLQLEARVFDFLARHAGTLKLQATMDDLMQLTQQIKNVLAASKAALAQDRTQLQGQIGELQARLEAVSQKFRGIEADAAVIEGEVSDLIQGRMQSLKERLFEHIHAVLDASEQPDSPRSARGRTGRWRGVWQAAKAALGRRDPDVARNDALLQLTLAELHASIQDSMNAEIAEFWHDLEQVASEQQVALFGRINRVLQHLAAEVDDTVGGLLSLRLQAVPLRLQLPEQEAVHSSLQALITQGIQAIVVSRMEQHEEHYMEPVRRSGGLCYSYVVHEPRLRTRSREVQETHYEPDVTKIKDHFISMVERRVSISERHVKAYVHRFVTDKVKQASASIVEYGQRYQAAMQGALASHCEGELARAAAAERADQRLAAFSQLLLTCSALSDRLSERATDSHAPAAEGETAPRPVGGDEAAETGDEAAAAWIREVTAMARGAILATRPQQPAHQPPHEAEEAAASAEAFYFVDHPLFHTAPGAEALAGAAEYEAAQNQQQQHEQLTPPELVSEQPDDGGHSDVGDLAERLQQLQQELQGKLLEHVHEQARPELMFPSLGSGSFHAASSDGQTADRQLQAGSEQVQTLPLSAGVVAGSYTQAPPAAAAAQQAGQQDAGRTQAAEPTPPLAEPETTPVSQTPPSGQAEGAGSGEAVPAASAQPQAQGLGLGESSASEVSTEADWEAVEEEDAIEVFI